MDSRILGIVESSCDHVQHLRLLQKFETTYVIREIFPKFCDNCDSWDLVVVEQLSESCSSGNKGGVPGVTHSFSDPLP